MDLKKLSHKKYDHDLRKASLEFDRQALHAIGLGLFIPLQMNL